MNFFFTYLFHSPLMRMATFWLVIGVLGISVFGFRMAGMRVELASVNQNIQASIIALQKIDEAKDTVKQQELEKIIEEIERYRPSVAELLGFLESVENLGKKRSLDIELYSVKTEKDQDTGDVVTYKLQMNVDQLSLIENFLEDFENNPYATKIQSFDISRTEDNDYHFNLIFILHTRLS